MPRRAVRFPAAARVSAVGSPNHTLQARRRAAAVGERSERVMLMSDDRIFYWGLFGPRAISMVGAVAVYVSFDRPFSVRYADGRVVEGTCAAVAPCVPHRVVSPDRCMAILHLEPESVDLAALDWLGDRPEARAALERLAERIRALYLRLARGEAGDVLERLDIDTPLFGAPLPRRRVDPRIARVVECIRADPSATGVACSAGITIGVSLKIDVGYHRVGVDPSVAVSFGTRVAEIRGVKLDAIFTHAGQAYNRGTTAEIEKDTIDEAAIMAGVAEDMRQKGLSIECVSVGSTPTAKFGFARPGLTEARPGNYVYLDRTQVGLGTCTFDECAMTVLATVVSHPVGDRMTLDAGSKTLSSDILRPAPDGHGLIAGSESRLVKLSEEHGVVAIAAGETYSIGDRVRVYPNHACVVSNLHNRVYGVRGETVETEFEVAARGCVE